MGVGPFGGADPRMDRRCHHPPLRRQGGPPGPQPPSRQRVAPNPRRGCRRRRVRILRLGVAPWRPLVGGDTSASPSGRNASVPWKAPPMAIKKLPNGRWEASYRDPAGRERVKHHRTAPTPTGGSPPSRTSSTAATTSTPRLGTRPFSGGRRVARHHGARRAEDPGRTTSRSCASTCCRPSPTSPSAPSRPATSAASSQSESRPAQRPAPCGRPKGSPARPRHRRRPTEPSDPTRATASEYPPSPEGRDGVPHRRAGRGPRRHHRRSATRPSSGSPPTPACAPVRSAPSTSAGSTSTTAGSPSPSRSPRSRATASSSANPRPTNDARSRSPAFLADELGHPSRGPARRPDGVRVHLTRGRPSTTRTSTAGTSSRRSRAAASRPDTVPRPPPHLRRPLHRARRPPEGHPGAARPLIDHRHPRPLRPPLPQARRDSDDPTRRGPHVHDLLPMSDASERPASTAMCRAVMARIAWCLSVSRRLRGVRRFLRPGPGGPTTTIPWYRRDLVEPEQEFEPGPPVYKTGALTS